MTRTWGDDIFAGLEPKTIGAGHIHLTTWVGAGCTPRDILHTDDLSEALRFAADALEEGLRVHLEKN